MVKNPPACEGGMGYTGSVPGSGRSLGAIMVTHSIIFAQKIPWTEEPSGLQSVGPQ